MNSADRSACGGRGRSVGLSPSTGGVVLGDLVGQAAWQTAALKTFPLAKVGLVLLSCGV